VLETVNTLELVERVLRGQLHAALGRRPHIVGIFGWSGLARKDDLHGETVFWMPRSLQPRFYERVMKYIRSLGVEPVFREVNVSGLPRPRRARRSAAKRPNSIRRVLSGFNDSANFSSRSCKSAGKAWHRSHTQSQRRYCRRSARARHSPWAWWRRHWSAHRSKV
jgi:hypothetical protein